MGIEKKVYSFRLEASLVEKIKYYSQKENRTFSNFVETVLKDKIKELDKEEKQ